MYIYQNLLLIINLHEQQAYTVVQLSDLAKNWHFCTPIIVNISIPQPLDPKTFGFFLSSMNIVIIVSNVSRCPRTKSLDGRDYPR